MLKSFFPPFSLTSIIVECSVFMQIGRKGTLKTFLLLGNGKKGLKTPLSLNSVIIFRKHNHQRKAVKLIGNQTQLVIVFILFWLLTKYHCGSMNVNATNLYIDHLLLHYLFESTFVNWLMFR